MQGDGGNGIAEIVDGTELHPENQRKGIAGKGTASVGGGVKGNAQLRKGGMLFAHLRQTAGGAGNVSAAACPLHGKIRGIAIHQLVKKDLKLSRNIGVFAKIRALPSFCLHRLCHGRGRQSKDKQEKSKHQSQKSLFWIVFHRQFLSFKRAGCLFQSCKKSISIQYKYTAFRPFCQQSDGGFQQKKEGALKG